MKLISIPATGNEDIHELLDRVSSYDLDGLEIRGDKMLGSVDLARVKKKLNGITIYTCRAGYQTDEERRQRYQDALKGGFDFVDVDMEDYDLLAEVVEPYKHRLIVSYHNYGGAELPFEITDKLFSLEASVHKVAIQVEDSSTGFLALQRVEKLLEQKSSLVFTFMGNAGEWSRAAYASLGSKWTYLGIPGTETAPGQIDPLKWQSDYQNLSREDAELYGIIGKPIEHSLSPRFHNQFFMKASLPALYVRFPTSNLEQFFHTLPEKVKGLSVTTPYKREVVPYLDELDPVAHAAGVVNTISRTETGGLKGWNTDGTGIRAALDHHEPDWKDADKILVLGAGGVARSVLATFQDVKDKIIIRNRTEENAHELAGKFGVKAVSMRDNLDLDNSIVIQATSVGMGEDKSVPIPPFWLGRSTIVVESIYYPEATPLVQVARDNGSRVIPGYEMFLHQAIAQQKIWFDGRFFDYQEAVAVLPKPGQEGEDS